jgi:hypothetical protein
MMLFWFPLVLSSAVLSNNLPVQSIPVSGQPTLVHAADLNGDRRPDLVIALKGQVAVLLNGEKQWRESARFDFPREAVALAGADFDGDGAVDIAIADHDTYGVAVAKGDGKGGFRLTPVAVRAKTTGRPHIHGLQAGDLNGDRKPDLLFASSGEGELIPLLNNGNGSFTPGAPVKVGSTAWYPTLADFNRDGRLDAVSADFNRNQVHVVLGDGKGSFAPAPRSPFTVFARPFWMKAGDVDGDGSLDVYGVHDDHGRLTVLLGDGKGGFTQMAGSPFDLGAEAYGVQLADLNRDGRMDAAFPLLNGELRVLYGKANGGFEPVVAAGTGAGSFWITAADLDGNGSLKLLVPDPRSSAIKVYLAVSK